MSDSMRPRRGDPEHPLYELDRAREVVERMGGVILLPGVELTRDEIAELRRLLEWFRQRPAK